MRHVHRLAAYRRPVQRPELVGERWIARAAGTAYGQLMVSLCRQAGLVPDIVHRGRDYAVVASLVADGHGIAFVRAAAALSRWSIAAKPVEAQSAGRDIIALLRTCSTPDPPSRPSCALRRRA
ncbi:LysR substrate-binding domain-containing protein [Actinomadura rubrisoli]|uniref:LysR substrate-binding domain-containing protein n=1 Tax=Actinomadura rubrisoli TaxID=2530368 RepID=UPI001405316F|nr:LysR substrate-binding domain-containing protein [Actinomadura rubrisoli]